MENLKFVQDLQNQIYYFNKVKEFSNIVILCVGTNKVIGDSVGPKVGQKLMHILYNQKNNKDIAIYGNMVQTLNFKNANQVIQSMFQQYENPFVITVDAALGTEKMVEKVVVSNGKIQIGNSLGRSICCDSHINIKGIVGKYNNNPGENMKTLMDVKEETIDKVSNKITYGIYKMIEEINNV